MRMGSASSGRARACVPPVPPVVLLVLLVVLAAGRAGADPVYQGPLLYGLDPVVRATEDPRLLGVERLVLLRRLETLGVRPSRDGGRRPGLETAIQRRFLERSGVDLERVETLLEYNDTLGLVTRIQYPKWHYLFPAAETLPGGILYYPPRRMHEPGVDIFVDDLESAMTRTHQVRSLAGRTGQLAVVGAGKRAQDEDGLINLTIPIKLPRTLEKIIGKGEKTRIKISGREHMAISAARARWSSPSSPTSGSAASPCSPRWTWNRSCRSASRGPSARRSSWRWTTTAPPSARTPPRSS